MKLFRLLFFFIISNQIFAQSTHFISGIINDDSGVGLSYANVLLLKQTDSTFVKGTITLENGTYKLESISNGNYLIVSSFVGYQSAYSNPFSLSQDYTVETLILAEGEQLDEVVIQYKKPLYEQKIDRMVINVENSIVSSSGSALEILERSPGVNINRQSNSISLVGKDGVVVMINGKTNYMPASAILQMLEGMSANNIKSIELITTPPANFDAEGNAGFINIVLKKRTDLGLNGLYSISVGYGEGETTSNNLSFNYRKNKINLYGNYSYSIDKRHQKAITSREYEKNNDLLFTKTYSDRSPRQRNHNVRLGLDIQASDKTFFGILVNGFDNRWSMDAFNENTNRKNNIPTSFVELINVEVNHLKHYGFNFNFKHNFTKDKFISFDIDYLNYVFNNPIDYTNTFFDENKIFIKEELLISRKNTPLSTWVGKFDYSNRIADKVKLEMGVKSTKSIFENNVSIENLINDSWIIDPSLSNISKLDEKIYAAYSTMDYNISDKTSIKIGLRYEYTDTKLETDTDGLIIDRQYGEWFPSAFFNQKFNDYLNMNISYSRRITRPTFNELAPFTIFLDPNTLITGNSSLQPSISNTYKYGINYKSYFLSIQYTNEDSSIVRFQEQIDEDTGLLIFGSSNLNYIKTFSVTIGSPLKISDWWRIQNNLEFIKQKVSAFYNNDLIELSIANFSINSTSSFKIFDNFSAELTGFYLSPKFFGYAKFEESYGFDIGFQQNFGDEWGILKFSIKDILDSVITLEIGTDLPDQNIKTKNIFDLSNRTFTLSYSKNFGNRNLKSKRDRETGSEEERRRVN